MRIALIHDYFLARGGAERVAGHLAAAFPGAPVYTSAFRVGSLPTGLSRDRLVTTPLHRIPAVQRAYRTLLPFYAPAFDRLHLRGFDLVVASSSAWAHTVRADAPVVVYCHTPPRFLWATGDYVAHDSSTARLTVRALAPMFDRLRARDLASASRATTYIANSTAVAERIERIYEREAEVVFPPVEIDRFFPQRREDFALVVSRLQPYKRIDLAVEACERIGLPLIVIGEGPARRPLDALAGRRTTFLGRLEDDEVADYLSRACVLIVPAEEDFGLTPVEAAAAGCPVVAFGRGGALDTVVDGVTGVLFHESTPEGLSAAIQRAVEHEWPVEVLVDHARLFHPDRFAAQIHDICARAVGVPAAGVS